MKRLLSNLNTYFETVPDWLRKRRWLAWVFFVALTVFFSFGIQRNTFDMSLESWFGKDDPAKLALNEFREEFGSDDSIYLVYKPKDGDVFSPASLKAVHGIREELRNYRMQLKEGESSMLDHITRVDTIVSANILKVEGDTLVSKDFVGNSIPSTKTETDELRNLAKVQKNFPLLYFSNNSQYGGILIQTDFGTIPLETGQESGETEDEFESSDEEVSMEVDASAEVTKTEFKPTEFAEYLGLMEAIDGIIYQSKYADHLEYYPVGNAPMMKLSMEIMEEMGPLTVGLVVIMVVLLWILFRSFSAVLWPIVIVGLCCVWAIGLSGWLGTTITTMLVLTVMLVLAIGIADSIHIMSGYLYFRKKDHDHQTALREAFKKSALACLLTSITTMVGMLALAATPIGHIQVFGLMSALGVGLAFFLTIYLLPLMLDLWAPNPTTELESDKKRNILVRILAFPAKLTSKLIPDLSIILQRVLTGVLPIVERRPKTIIAFFLAIFAVCIYGASKVTVDSNMIEQFKEGTKIRQVYEIVDTHMMGTQNMEIYIRMGAENGIKDPQVLKRIEQLQQEIEQKYSGLVVRTSSLADVVKDAYRVLNEDRAEMYKIPDDRKMLSQTLFLFNNANPEDRRRLVSDDFANSHISVQLHNAGSYAYVQFFNDVRKDIDAVFAPLKSEYPAMNVSVTGGLSLIMELMEYITWSQIRSLGLAILVISIILVFVFGSFRAGGISIIPNLLPAAFTFGTLGLIGIPLDNDTIIIAPVIIGIAVDDTIHFITHYRDDVIQHGNIALALKNTIAEVGQAITFTSLILGCGFSVMAFSSNAGMFNVGVFGTAAIFVALFADQFLLPSMIIVFRIRFRKKRAQLEATREQSQIESAK